MYHARPIQQASARFEDLLQRGSGFPDIQCLEALEKIKAEDLDSIFHSFFFTGAHIEALVLGNLTAEDAQQLSSKLAKGLGLSKPLSSLPYRAEALLPSGKSLWQLDSMDSDDPNHAVMMKLQLPEGLEHEMLLRLLDKVLGAKFFEILRTQQQLGYIVQMAATVPMKLPLLVALVQTEFPPDHVRGETMRGTQVILKDILIYIYYISYISHIYYRLHLAENKRERNVNLLFVIYRRCR